MGPLELMAAGCVLVAVSAICLVAVPPRVRDIDPHLEDDGLTEQDGDDVPQYKAWR